jgi:hypothetical protein
MTSWRWMALLGLVATALPGSVPAQEQAPAETKLKPVFVSEPVVPTITPAVRDLPDWKPDPNAFGLEMKRREDFGFIPIEYPVKPKVDPLFMLQQEERSPQQPENFSTLVHNYDGQTAGASPPDTVGDVGPNHFVQAVNQSVSTIEVLDKATGANLKTFTLQSLTTVAPCNHGFCDPVVLYDRAADRWLISELPSSGGNVCVYVSTTGDPTGTWYAYSFAVETSTTDYPKYGVWPQNGNAGSYLIGVNAGAAGKHDLFALDRAKMLAGLPATFQKFSVNNLPNFGFQLVLPSTMQGNAPPPNGEPAVFARPHDDEAQEGASTPSFDWLDMWTLSVDWATPANSTLTQLAPLHIGDYDASMCGLGSIWNCMPQAGTTQKIDPIREPLHFPFQYRNFGDHQTLVGTFVEDVDGTDHAALRWFELRKTGAGAWSLFQEGVVGGEAGVHRSVGSIAMDQSGNIAIGYTRTGDSAPYFPSIYYRGRLASDPLGTMTQGENVIVDATTSKTNNERWGDYSGIGVDPADDCTFWYTTEYGGQGNTKVAAFKFDACGCLAVPAAPTASASVPQDNRIDVNWGDSTTSTITQYLVYRSTTSGGPYTQIATVADSSPGTAGGPSYTYHDDTVSGGTRYYYIVKSTDGGACTSAGSVEVSALATGQCRLAPTFAGLVSITNPGNATCTLNLSWSAGTSVCSGGVTYNVYRNTIPGFTPTPANRISSGVAGTAYTDAFGIVGGTTYYYVVRAVDTSNGVEDSNTAQKFGVPTGPLTTTTWTDTFEGSQSGGGFDQAGWTHSAINGGTNWAWSTVQKHDGTHSWFAADVGSISDKVLVSPSFGVGSTTTLSFFHTFKFEFSSSTCWDGGTLEYSLDGGSTWRVVPAGDFTAGAYNGTVSTSSSNPIGGSPAWCGGAIITMTPVTVNLGGDAGLVNKTVKIRWHEGDDANTSSTGWYVDTVTVTNAQTGGACTVGTSCTAPGAPNLTGAAGGCNGVSLAWTPGTGSTSSYNVYRATVPGGPYTKLGGMPIATTSYTDTTGTPGTTYYYVVKGACDAGGATESVASNERSAAPIVSGGACSDGNACTVGDTCQAGVCVSGGSAPPPGVASGLAFSDPTDLAWNSVSGATGYDVVRGTLSTLLAGGNFTPATDACLGDNVPNTFVTDGHIPAVGDGDWILIRAANACGTGTYSDGSPTQSASPDAGIGASPNACP